jgi:hypothetical protein
VNETQHINVLNIDNNIETDAFTRAELKNEKIAIKHDNSKFEPTLKLKGSDGKADTDIEEIPFNYTNINHAPVQETNRLTIGRGETVTLSNNNTTRFTDPDNDDAALRIETQNAEHLQFIDATLNQEVIAFLQEKIANGEIQAIHDGSNNPPSYEMRACDSEELCGNWNPASVTFQNTNPGGITPANNGAAIAGISIAVCITAIGCIIAVTAGGATTCYLIKKNQKIEKPHISMKEIELKSKSVADFREIFTSYCPKNSLIDPEDIELTEFIQAGGEGSVYKALWEKTTTVAYKSFALNSAELIKSFVQEVELTIDLNHPNIVRIYGICIAEKPAIVMEYMPEGSLHDLLHKTETSLSEYIKVSLLHDIALGLKYLHERNIMHRDLKPSNVLIYSGENSESRAKLADFGLSIEINEGQKTKTCMIGTYEYAAPEVHTDITGKYEKPADIFSFGIIAWEVFTKERPYAKNQNGDKINLTAIPANTMITKKVSLEIPKKCSYKSIIEKCWNVDKPEKRPTARELVTYFFKHKEKINGKSPTSKQQKPKTMNYEFLAPKQSEIISSEPPTPKKPKSMVEQRNTITM